ncbi:2-dehydropantoate 2-reductase [Corynebacterium aquilae]|uniref:2-dehydropantoate 2-reductase n=1 Tax=Corynebacterium aquilae TaxID=203263 RepID=UPI000951C58C|nr:2-dehydropantoate 2-reductase [Corynebacterium aquilae]
MKIAILGAGAVGGTFGARLHEAGEDVTLVARGQTYERLRSRGLVFDDLGTKKTLDIPTVGSVAELENPDCIVIATKALDPAHTFDNLPPNVPIVLTQNSVESPYIAADAVGEQWVVPGVVRGFMHYLGPATIAFTPGPLSLNVGALEGTNEQSRQAARDLVAALNRSGVGGDFLDDILVDVWMKAMFVATFGALGSAANAPLDVLHGRLRPTFEAMMDDVYRTGVAMGVPLAEDAVAQTLAFSDKMPSGSTTSMQRDFLRGDTCELSAQLPAVIRLADSKGVRVDASRAICALLELELDRRDGVEPRFSVPARDGE